MGPDENGSRFKPGAIFALGPDGEKYEPVVFTSFLNPEAYAPLQQVCSNCKIPSVLQN
jgi:hypothetical protein